MKKMFAVLLALTMVLGMSACGGDASSEASGTSSDVSAPSAASDPEAEKLFAQMVSQFASVDRVNLDIQTVITTSLDGQSTSSDDSGILRAENIGKEGMRVSSEMKTLLPGSQMELETKSYYANGMFMMDAIGSDLMCELPIDRAMAQFDITGALKPADYVKNLQITKDKKTKTCTLTGTADLAEAGALADVYLNLTGLNLTGIAWDAPVFTFVTDNDGNLLSAVADVSFSFDSNGMIATCEIWQDYTFKEIGDDFAVELPDASSFTEVPPDVLGVK